MSVPSFTTCLHRGAFLANAGASIVGCRCVIIITAAHRLLSLMYIRLGVERGWAVGGGGLKGRRGRGVRSMNRVQRGSALFFSRERNRPIRRRDYEMPLLSSSFSFSSSFSSPPPPQPFSRVFQLCNVSSKMNI